MQGKFDVAAVLNLSPSVSLPTFVRGVHSALSSNGQLLMTTAERHTLSKAKPIFSEYFRLQSQKLWLYEYDAPHAYLVVGSKI